MTRTIERIMRTAMLVVAFMLCATSARADVQILDSSTSLVAFWPQFSTETLTSGSYSLSNFRDGILSDGVLTLESTNGKGLAFTNANTWAIGDGITVMLNYSDFSLPASGSNRVLLTSSLENVSKSAVGVFTTTSGKTRGFWCVDNDNTHTNGLSWDNSDTKSGVTHTDILASGTTFFQWAYTSSNDTKGIHAYNINSYGTASTIYEATGLFTSATANQPGKEIIIGSSYHGDYSWYCANDMKVHSVAIFKKTLSADERAAFARTRKLELTADTTFADLTATSFQDLYGNSTSWNAGTNLCINVPSTAADTVTLTLPAGGINTGDLLHIQVAEGKTLVLTGGTATAGSIIITGKGKVATAVATQLKGTLKGDGTLECDMNNTTTKPANITCNNAAWKGTMWIKNGAYTGWLLNDYGSTASTLRLTNINCYIDGNETANPVIDLDGTGLTISNGNSQKIETIKKLTGTGTLTLSGGSADGNGLVIQDASKFYGTIQNTSPAGGSRRYKVTIGASGTYGYDRNMVIANGYTASIATGKTWSMPGGFEVSGILAFVGTGSASGPVSTANGSTLDFSASTSDTPISGTLTLASGTTIKLPADAEFPYQIASSGDGLVDNVTIQIKDGATTTSAVKLVNGALSLVKSATLSNSPEMKDFSAITWSSVTSGDYLLTISGTPTLLNFNDISGVDSLKIVVQNSSELYVKGEMPATTTVEGLTNLTIADDTIADDATASFYAGYTRLYAQIGDTTTGNDAISATGTTISVADPMSVPLNAGNYVIARWLTPQKLSNGYGHVNTVSATLNTESTPGLTSELVYMADRIVLRVYDATAQAAKGTLKIWPYGDSITEGYNASNTRANYRVLLGQKLKLLGYNVEMVGCFDKVQTSSMQDAIDPAGQTIPAAWKWHSAKHGGTIGVTAATSYQRSSMLESVDTHCAQVGNPDVVLLHGGINDLYATDQTVQSVFDNWTNVVEHILTDLPNTKVVVSTLLYCDAADSRRKTKNSTLVEPFNTAVKTFMETPPATWSGRVFLADLNSYFAASRDDAAPAGTTVDRLHPDWWGHDQMAEGWLSVVTNQFTASQTFPSATAIVAPTSGELGAANKAELADYRRGFKRYGVINVSNDLDPENYTYSNVDATAPASGIARVGYFVEYVRTDNNVSHWVWVDMDAFGTTIADLGLPAANHQQVVDNLHVKSSHNGIDDVAADDNSVQGWIEFSPFTYTGDSSGVTGAPLRHGAATGTYSMYDWDDKLGESGAKGCMQVFRKTTPSGRPAQTLFAFNNWNQNETQAEFGIGNFSQHFHGGYQTFDYTETASLSQMNASAYSVKTIEIWTNPDKLEYSNDKRGSSLDGATFNAGAETWTITIPGSGSAVIDEISLGLRSNNDTERVKRTTVRLAIYTSGGDLVATSDLMNGDGSEDLTTKFADGGYRQRFAFSEDCVLERGTAYTLKFLNSSGADGVWPATLENATGASDYSPIVNTTKVIAWRVAQTIYASKLYEATLPTIANTFGGLTFSPALPTDYSGSALLVNVPAETTAVLTFGSATTVGSIRFNIPDGSSLTIADPSNLKADKIVVYGSGTLAFGDPPDFGDADIDIAADATIALAAGQVLTTTGNVTVDSGAALTLAPATIAGLSASLVSAASISGEIALTAPDENSDYSLTVSATGVTLHRTSQAKFTYNPVPGENTPSGWITSWGGEPLATTSLRVGPSSDIPYVYHVASGKHPWVGLAARTSGFSYAIYADVSHMESDKGVITAFGNKNKGLFLYRDGDYVKLAHVVNGSITTPSWVPGVAVPAGYHLYTVTFDPTTGAAALYLDDGSVCAATDGSTHAHLGTQGLNNGFQLGSVYEGVGDTGFHVGAGLAVCAVRGYDVVLQPEEVETISQSFPATDGKIVRHIIFDGEGKTLTVYSAVEADGASTFFGVEAGAVVIPSGETVVVSNVRNANTGSNKTGTLTINGKLQVTAVSTAPDVVDNGDNMGIVNGWWSKSGSSIINVTGELDAPNAYLEVIYQNNAASGTLNVDGGTVKVKGLYAHSNADNKGHVTISNGGVLELGEQVDSLHIIEKSFGSGIYRVKGSGTENGSIAFTSTDSSNPTTLDPYGCTLTLNGMTGAGYVTVDDTSDVGNGKVVFGGAVNTFTGYVVMTDANAGNIDISGYTGTVLCQGTEATTIAMFDRFAGTVYFTSNVDATALDLSGATVHIADNCTFTAVAGKEGSLVLGSGAVATLNVDDNTVKYEGYVPVVSGSGTVGYYNTGTSEAVSGADYVNGNNLLPYYNVWSASATASENTLFANAAARWKSDDGVSGVLPADNKNVAFKLENGDTVTLLVDATKTFNDIQVFGNGTLIIQQSGNNVLTVGKGLYTTANTTVQIDSGLVFDSGAKIDVDSAIPMHYVVVNCGSAESPFSIPAITGSGMLSVAAGKALTTASSSGSMLSVDGTVTFTGAGSTGAIYVTATGTANVNASITATTFSVYAGGVVNVAAGVTLTAPTLAVNGTVNMTSTSVLSGTTSLSGAGTVNWNGKNPDLTVWKDCSTWCGTNVVSSLSTDEQRQIQNWGRYASESSQSFIKLIDVKGWTDANVVINPEVILENGTAGYGLEISNGSTTDNPTYFAKISGSGTLKQSGSGGNQRYVLRDVSDFTGSIEKTDTVRVLIIDATTTQANLPAKSNQGYMFVANITAKIGDGKGWSVASDKNIDIAGTSTIELLGAATMATSGNGALVFNSGATLKLSGDTAKYLTTTGTLTWPSSGRVTIDASACASSAIKIPVFAADASDVAFNMGTIAFTPPAGSTVGRWTTYVEYDSETGKYIYSIGQLGTIFSVW